MSRAMKDSGVPWIGEIPSHWRTERIKTIFSERTELSEDGTEDLLSVSEYYGVDKRAGRVEEGDFVSRSESLVGYKKCYKGDFVSNIMLAWKGSLGVSDYDGVVSPAYCVYKPSESVYPKYYHYLFRTSLYTGRFRCFSKGIIDSRLRLYSPYFFDIEAIIPPKEEQQSIADFLDKKCGEIDEMVSLQEKIVEELKAYKQSVITEAVCKGLNPDVPMKDSGIEWIGQIPEGWETKRLKYVGYGENGLTYSPADMCGEEGVLVLRSSNIQGSRLVFDDNVYVSCSIPEKLFVKRGDIIVCSRNGSAALVGKCALVEEDINASFGAFMLRFRTSLYNRYAYYLLTGVISNYKQLFSTTTINQLTLGTFNNLFAPVSKKESEQKSIADFLDNKCTEIDTLISLKQSKIDALKEYKKSIIYEYITGKKEVNG